MNSITLIDYEIWLDWIEETYNFEYEGKGFKGRFRRTSR